MSLSLKGLVKKVYRAFKMSVGVLVPFSSVAPYHGMATAASRLTALAAHSPPSPPNAKAYA